MNRISDLTPRPPSLKGQGEKSENPPLRSGVPNPPSPFPERAGGEIRKPPLSVPGRGGRGGGVQLRH